MSGFQTKHGEPISRILAAYNANPNALVVRALETYISTAESQAKQDAQNEVADNICEGLHQGEAKGLKCLKCYMAEQHFHQEEVVRAEIDAARSQADGTHINADGGSSGREDS